jgi:nicotinamidase/pyrazinamidase
MNAALLLVDLQNDFCPGGTLAVTEGDITIEVANYAIDRFKSANQYVIATKDWHPANHKSFASQSHQPVGQLGLLNGLPQVWWPDHCIQDTFGAEFHSALNADAIDTTIYKGQDPEIDSYSAFFDNGRRHQTDLDNWLKRHHIKKIVVMGLATDYCVKFTVIDALSLGYEVSVLIDGCRGVNLSATDSAEAAAEMQSAGAKLINLDRLTQSDF